MTWSVDTYNAVYRARYPKGVTPYLPKENPLLAFFAKKTGQGGRPYKAMIRTNAVRGGSTFDKAKTNTNAPTWVSFDIDDFAEEHVVISLSRKLMKKASSSDDAVVAVVEQAVSAAVEEAALSIGLKLAGNGGGARGVVSSFTSTTIVLTDESHGYRFPEDMMVQASDDDGTDVTPAGLRDAGAAAEVTGISESSGTVTLTVDTTLIPSLANGDFLFRDGDYDSFSQRIIQGIGAWNPATAPGASDSFFGVERDSNVNALAGKRMNCGGMNIFDVLRLASARVKNNRGKVTHFLGNPLKGNDIDQAMGAKQIFTQKTAYAGVELQGVKVSTQMGVIDCMTFSEFAEDAAHLINREGWELVCYGSDLMEEVSQGSDVWHLEESKDAYQHRDAGYLQLVCAKDGKARTQDSIYLNFAA